MISLEHVIEVALLMLVAYSGGCMLGYGIRIALRALGTRRRIEAAQGAVTLPVASQDISIAPSPPKSAARRLVQAVEENAVANLPSALAARLPQRPFQLPSPRHGRADDLKQIKGIGAKTESTLNDLGIYHLDQIAAWTASNIDWLEGRVAIRGRIAREQWVEQATLLATATKAA